MTINSRTPGRGIVFYRCNTGYIMVGPSFFTCQNGGTWSGSAPTCQGDFGGVGLNTSCCTIDLIIMLCIDCTM